MSSPTPPTGFGWVPASAPAPPGTGTEAGPRHSKTASPPEVVVAGCVGIDTNIYLWGREIDWSVEANFAQDLDCVGQAGGYTARGFAALGCRTAFVGALGEDHAGLLVRQTFAADGIAALFFPDRLGTHRSVNFMAPGGGRKNFYDGRGQMDVAYDLVACRALLSGARLLHAHLEHGARHLLPVARELGLVVSCDLQDVVDPEDPYRRDFIEQADVLFFSCANFAEPAAIVTRLLDRRPGRIVIGGRGAAGVVLGTVAQGVRFFPAPLLDLPVVDTNGAGDSLAVGFLVSHLFDGHPLEEAVRRGQLAARHACTLRATSDGLVTRARLEALAART